MLNSDSKEQVTVIFVRHGESAWNEIFNKVAHAFISGYMEEPHLSILNSESRGNSLNA